MYNVPGKSRAAITLDTAMARGLKVPQDTASKTTQTEID